MLTCDLRGVSCITFYYTYCRTFNNACITKLITCSTVAKPSVSLHSAITLPNIQRSSNDYDPRHTTTDKLNRVTDVSLVGKPAPETYKSHLAHSVTITIAVVPCSGRLH